MKSELFSIIIPCYNEGNKLINNVKKIINYLSEINIHEYELIIVNDGSTDETKDVCEQISNDYNKVKFFSYEKNKGKGEAVRVGIENSLGGYVLFMDADLSTDISAIKNVLNLKSEFDVIIGSRRNKNTVLAKKQPLIRIIIGKCCSIITNIIIPLNVSDTQCGFKAFEGNFAREMIKRQQLNGFAFDVEYLYMAKLNNKKITEIGVIWENDEDSKVSLFRSSIRFFSDLFKIRKNKKIYLK